MMLNFLLLLRVSVISVNTSSNSIKFWKYLLIRATFVRLKVRISSFGGKCHWFSTCLHLIFGWFIARGPSTLQTVLHQPDYQREAELEDLMTDNTSALQRMLFLNVASVTSQPMSLTKERNRQILDFGTFDSRSSNQRRQAHGAVSKESIYEDVFKSLMDALPEFLRADPLAERVP